MSNEEIMREELEVEIEEVEGTVEDTEYPETSGNLLGTIIGGFIGAGILGGTVYVLKHKEELKKKRAEKLAAKLEKQGYRVSRPLAIEAVEDCEEDFIDEEEDSEDEE